MYPYTIDDPIESPLVTSVKVTVNFPSGDRWLFFATPQLLSSVGDYVADSNVRLHLGERHMIVVSDISPTVIELVLRQLADDGELESRTLPVSQVAPNNSFKPKPLRGSA